MDTKITAKELHAIIEQCMDEIYFSYNGKACGVFTEVDNFKPIFTLWCGQKTQAFDNVDEVMKAKFFDGKSLYDLINDIALEIA